MLFCYFLYLSNLLFQAIHDIMTLFQHFYVFLYNKLQLFITHHVHLPHLSVAKDF
jgi:hypothetical protein